MLAKDLGTTALVYLSAMIIGSAQGGALSRDGMERSPFAEPDMIPGMQARCDEIRRLTQEVPIGAERMDFSAVGALTLVHSDGTLVYLGLCTEPDLKVLCVTYSTNGMKVGDVAIVTGGYRRLGPDLIVLDPCLAARPDDSAR